MSRGRRRIAFAAPLAAALALALGAAPAFATVVSLSGGPDGSQLQITGDNNDDAITVSESGGTITITDTGTGGVTTADPDCTQVNPTTVTCPTDPPGATGPVFSLVGGLNSGVDSYTNQNLDLGFEALSAGSTATGAKAINGGPGDSFLNGGRDNDTINGGGGDDSVSGGSFGPFVADGADTLIGGPGTDRTGYFDRQSAVGMSLNGQADDGAPGEGDNLLELEILSGGEGDDIIAGDAQSNELRGNAGNDLIDGREGADELFGDTGDDGIVGGPGRDAFECSFGFDTAVSDPEDRVDNDCERTGAEVTGDTSPVTKKWKARVRTRCPAEEFAPCAGALRLLLNGRTIGRGKFEIPAGASEGVPTRITKRGRKALTRGDGTLRVTAEARTSEPLGVSSDEAKLLLRK